MTEYHGQGGEIISPKRAEALTRRKALEAAGVQRKERRKELAKQRAVQQRAQQIKAQRSKQDTGDMLRQEARYHQSRYAVLSQSRAAA